MGSKAAPRAGGPRAKPNWPRAEAGRHPGQGNAQREQVPKTGQGPRPNSQKLEAVNLHNHGKARAWRPLLIMLVYPAAAEIGRAHV